MTAVDDQHIKRLAEVGFVAAGHGYTAQAETIFQALQAVRPDSEYPLIGQALTKMSAQQYGEAMNILQNQALLKNPDSALVRCFLGLSLKLAGHAQDSHRWLTEAAATAAQTNDAQAGTLAQALLAES